MNSKFSNLDAHAHWRRYFDHVAACVPPTQQTAGRSCTLLCHLPVTRSVHHDRDSAACHLPRQPGWLPAPELQRSILFATLVRAPNLERGVGFHYGGRGRSERQAGLERNHVTGQSIRERVKRIFVISLLSSRKETSPPEHLDVSLSWRTDGQEQYRR
jgi:hypothetical protein